MYADWLLCSTYPELSKRVYNALQVAPHALALGMKVVMFVRTPSKISERYRLPPTAPRAS